MNSFSRTLDSTPSYLLDPVLSSGELSTKQKEDLENQIRAWNFYKGYHWEELPEQDKPEITVNYCRKFVDKYVAFELGNSFTITVNKKLDEEVLTEDGETLLDYLNNVWVNNNQYDLTVEIGQMKAITARAWVQVRFEEPGEFEDPFGFYPKGRIRLLLHNSKTVFADYDEHDKTKLVKLTLMYYYDTYTSVGLTRRPTLTKVQYKQVWTKDSCVVTDNGVSKTYPNRYGIIPFVQIKNLSDADTTWGRGDLDDIIPLNMEVNLKKSDISEIIEYHSAPITIVYGAKIGSLEKGANKMWGGIPKDAKVQNLEMQSELGASRAYVDDTKEEMCQIASVPSQSLGGATAISNTSGVALQYINLPLIEQVKIKRQNTQSGIEAINRLIILISEIEGLIEHPTSVTITTKEEDEVTGEIIETTETVPVSNKEFYTTEVRLQDTLPKDMLLELQQIQMEMKMGLEDRRGALIRLKREDPEARIKAIDKDRAEHPDVYGINPQMGEQDPQLNSGFTNGQTPVEQVRTEITGSNGMSN